MFCSYAVIPLLRGGIDFNISGFLGEAKTEVVESEIAHTLPCRRTMRELFQETAVEALILVLHESLDAKICRDC